MDPRAAMLTGKLSFRGEMGLGIQLGYWIRKAVEQHAAGARGPEELEVTERGKWEKDSDAEACVVCQEAFAVRETLPLGVGASVTADVVPVRTHVALVLLLQLFRTN